jgi:putrescine transport system substrate-binding protein
MEPKVIADTVNAIHVQSGNADAAPFIDPEILHDPAIYPPPEMEKKIFAISDSPAEIDRLRTRLWTKIKTGR